MRLLRGILRLVAAFMSCFGSAGEPLTMALTRRRGSFVQSAFVVWVTIHATMTSRNSVELAMV
jgi:hypothetical protein